MSRGGAAGAGEGPRAAPPAAPQRPRPAMFPPRARAASREMCGGGGAVALPSRGPAGRAPSAACSEPRAAGTSAVKGNYSRDTAMAYFRAAQAWVLCGDTVNKALPPGFSCHYLYKEIQSKFPSTTTLSGLFRIFLLSFHAADFYACLHLGRVFLTYRRDRPGVFCQVSNVYTDIHRH